MRLLAFLAVGCLAASAFAENYKSGTCDGTEFGAETWGQLTVQEPRLLQELDAIAKASGQTGTNVKMQNCRIEWPVSEQGYAVEGWRTAVLHHVWYNNSQSPPIRAEGGMRVIWWTTYKEEWVGGTSITKPVRTVKGFTICRSEPVCAVLNVLGVKNPSPVSLNLF